MFVHGVFQIFRELFFHILTSQTIEIRITVLEFQHQGPDIFAYIRQPQHKWKPYPLLQQVYSGKLASLHDQSKFQQQNKMQPTKPNAHTYVHGTDVETHGYVVTQNTFLQ